jgi:hypothetical protein
LTGSDIEPEGYLDALHLLSETLPGLGGRAAFDGLTPGEVLGLADRIRKNAETKAAAQNRAVAAARARHRGRR